MVLAPEGDGDANETFARFLRFDGDCAGQTAAVARGYELDIYDVIAPGEAPSNNTASCTAVFECTPGAVFDTIELTLRDGATAVGTVNVDVAADCTAGPTYSCNLSDDIDIPENTPIDIDFRATGGAPVRFASAALNFSPYNDPEFEKTSAGAQQLLVGLSGCDNDFQMAFIVR
jgi:hypothetical protein